MKITNRRLLLALCCASSALFGGSATIDPAAYLNDVKYLASPELRGRGTGAPGLEKAAAFIAGKYREFGLKPIPGKTYFQQFEVITIASLGKGNRLRFVGAGDPLTFKSPDEFVPLNISSAGRITGPVVFAGYGITAPNYNYDDYAGLDVKGKVVMVLRHEPQEADEKSVFAGKSFTQHAVLASKATNAKMHGAAAVILINDQAAHGTDPDALERFGSTSGPNDSGIPIIQMKQERLAAWFKAAGKDLAAIEAGIDKDLKPASFAFPAALRVDAYADVLRVRKTVRNIAAYLPGETDEYVIVGAHYDHLGLGGPGSLAPSLTGTVHPGADDNASGTAGVIELARWYSKQPKMKRGILFLNFAGEEMGLLGSQYYADHPEMPLEKAAAMLNMDMIGRMRDKKIYIGGAGTGAGLRAILEQVSPKYKLTVDYSDDAGFDGSSDHISFVTKHVPALFFFSGLHGDYHKPSDTWDKIDAPDAATLLGMVAEIADDVRGAAEKPQFVRVVSTRVQARDVLPGPVGGAPEAGYGAYFGSVPDFGEGTKGVKFADVREGSPAAKAGLKAGDVLVEYGGKPIQNLYDFTYALRESKPGDTVIVKVIRDGKTIEAAVLVTRRQ